MYLCIIIVNWNTKNLLKNCLQSIFQNIKDINFKIIVIDNASTDGSVEMVKEKFPMVTLLENTENVGFAKANNQAFKLVGVSKYILLLNSDTVLKAGTLEKIASFMESNPKAGAVAPALRLPNGDWQTGGAGFGPSLKTALNYFLFLSVLFPQLFKGLFINQRKFSESKRQIEVDWVAGACLLVRNDVIRKVGGLSEFYFMYAEDIDWCERIKKEGWKIFYLPYIEIIHHHGASSKQTSIEWLKSLIYYVKDKYGALESILFRIIACVGLGIRSIIYFALFIFSRNRKYKLKSYQMYIYALGTLR